MNKILAAALFTIVFAVISVSAQKDYCFQNDGLKIRQIVSFTITGNKVEGTLESGGYDADTSMETFDFTGTKSGNILTIKFQGKTPYEIAPGTKKIVWTLSTTALKVPTYGKDHKTNKYSAYTATYTKCKED